MQQARYKVETFIIPKGNQCHDEFMTNEEGNVKIANKFKKKDEIEQILNTEVFTITEAEGECSIPIMHLKDSFAIFKKDSQKIYTLNNITQMQMQRFNSLTSIDEKSEDADDKFNDLCYHGHKNGCTVPAPSPEDISENIFKENWLNRLEILRNREASLNDKEIALQCRERLLFQKEKELRMLERQLKERLKQMEQYFKRIQRSHKVYSKDIERVTDSRSSSESNRSHSSSTVFSSNSKSSTESHLCDKNIQNVCEYDQQETLHHNIIQERGSEAKKELVEEIKHDNEQMLENKISAKHMGTKSSTNSIISNSSKFHTGRYYRTKQRSKVLYDDLDSTLSADIGDASFIQTSKKFNPADYKKPFAFTRSASERRSRHIPNNDFSATTVINANTLKEIPLPLDSVEENKIFKRVSDNITASSSGCTIFQDYGLIDQQLATSKSQLKNNILCNDKRYSYLNLELEQKSEKLKKAKSLKERPLSWCEETNEWLQKKRQAYNLTTNRILDEDFDNKENAKFNVKGDIMDKSSKKKDVRRKVFTIFR